MFTVLGAIRGAVTLAESKPWSASKEEYREIVCYYGRKQGSKIQMSGPMWLVIGYYTVHSASICLHKVSGRTFYDGKQILLDQRRNIPRICYRGTFRCFVYV